MKKTIIALAAGALMSVGSLSYAAEQLSDGQMDQVAAGTFYTPYSWAETAGAAIVGYTASTASTGASLTSSGMFTSASAGTVAVGYYGAVSYAAAGSGFE